MNVSPLLALLTKQAVVEKVGDRWVLWTKDRSRRLGTHDTARQAYAQEYAIERSEERQKEAATTPAAPMFGSSQPKQPVNLPKIKSKTKDVDQLFGDPQAISPPPTPADKMATVRLLTAALMKSSEYMPDTVPDPSGQLDASGNVRMIHNPAIALPGQAPTEGQVAEAPDDRGFLERHKGLKGLAGEGMHALGSMVPYLPSLHPAGMIPSAVIGGASMLAQPVINAVKNKDFLWNKWVNGDVTSKPEMTYRPAAPLEQKPREGFWGGIQDSAQGMVTPLFDAVGSALAPTATSASQVQPGQGYWAEEGNQALAVNPYDASGARTDGQSTMPQQAIPQSGFAKGSPGWEAGGQAASPAPPIGRSSNDFYRPQTPTQAVPGYVPAPPVGAAAPPPPAGGAAKLPNHPSAPPPVKPVTPPVPGQ